jgi:hypothetical protein
MNITMIVVAVTALLTGAGAATLAFHLTADTHVAVACPATDGITSDMRNFSKPSPPIPTTGQRGF